MRKVFVRLFVCVSVAACAGEAFPERSERVEGAEYAACVWRETGFDGLPPPIVYLSDEEYSAACYGQCHPGTYVARCFGQSNACWNGGEVVVWPGSEDETQRGAIIKALALSELAYEDRRSGKFDILVREMNDAPCEYSTR